MIFYECVVYLSPSRVNCRLNWNMYRMMCTSNNNNVCICLTRPHLLDDLLQLPVLPLQLPGLFLVVVVGGRAGLQGVLLLRLPLAAGDETPHLDRRRDRNSIKKKIRTEIGYPAHNE